MSRQLGRFHRYTGLEGACLLPICRGLILLSDSLFYGGYVSY